MLSEPLLRAVDLLSSSQGEGKDEIRCRCVADALVADPVTRLPATSSEISFYLTFPEVMAKQIIRGALNEVDWIELMRLVSQARTPGLAIASYPQGIFDPLVPPLLTPLLDRVASLLGIPLNAPVPPLVVPPNWATLRTIVITVAAENSLICGVPDGFMESNLEKLRVFSATAWTETARVFHRVMGMRNPAGPVVESIFEPNSGAMAQLARLRTDRAEQKNTAQSQPELHGILHDGGDGDDCE